MLFRHFIGSLVKVIVLLSVASMPIQGNAEVLERFKTGMHIVMTGTGSAFPDPERGGASAAVIVDGTILQFDFGRAVMDNMMVSGINPVDVDYVFFTHHHFDHVATYDYFVMSLWIAARQKNVHVFGPPGTEQLHRGATYEMHKSDYEFVKFITEKWPPRLKVKPAAEPPFVVKDVQPGVIIENDKFKVTAVSTPHYPNGKLSLGYRVDSRYGSVVISGDTGPSKELTEIAKGADYLIHEMMKPDPGMLKDGKFSHREFQEASNNDRKKVEARKRPQTGHTAPSQLGELAQEAGVKNLIAYHLPPITSVPKAVEMSAMYTGSNPGEQIWTDMIHAVKKYYTGNFILAEDGMVFSIVD